MTKTPDWQRVEEALQVGLSGTGFSYPPMAKVQLFAFIKLLYQWNLVHNLTSVRDPNAMVQMHILDSLTVYPFLSSATHERVLDIGTGAGLPGIVLAVCRPEHSFVLLDSRQKKINFVQHVLLSLKIQNAVSVCARVESYQPDAPFDWVVSRAFSSLSTFVQVGGRLMSKGGRLVAMKGRMDALESSVPIGYTACVQPVCVPGLHAERTLVFVSKL